MPRIAVVTDSTADFPGDAQERLGIEMVPLTVVWDRDSFRDKLDLKIADFYALMRQRSTLPTTSAPSAGAFEETYERLLGQADHVISVHLAGKLSATLDVARSAAERVGGGRVSVVDSGQTTMCLGWLAMRAAELGAEDTEPAAIVRELESWVPRLRLYAVLDSLTNLQRGGRIGRAQALVGSLLNFKPLLLVKEGQVLPLERPRSRASAMRRIVDVAASQGRIQKIGVAEGDAPEIMEDLVRMVGERVPGVPIDRGEIGIVLGTHAGPGVFGVATLLAE
ncbi:MAG TPA: DegV family protein [Chloroflexota bacterium]|nr:DegV family protein [Chloroflexota bacterium]